MRWTWAGGGWGRSAAALGLAYVLVLQAVIGGLALGSHAAVAATFDAPICNPSGLHPGAGTDDPAGERNAPASFCCVLACAGSAPASPPADIGSAIEPASAGAGPVLPPGRPSPIDSADRAANSPRAPPV